jgi:hypothetical protein
LLKRSSKQKKGKGVKVGISILRHYYTNMYNLQGLEYLEGKTEQDYFNDMEIAQMYAGLNRRLMGSVLLKTLDEAPHAYKKIRTIYWQKLLLSIYYFMDECQHSIHRVHLTHSNKIIKCMYLG